MVRWDRVAVVSVPAEGERLLFATEATTVALVIVHHRRVAGGGFVLHIHEVEVAVDMGALMVPHLLHMLLALLPRSCVARVHVVVARLGLVHCVWELCVRRRVSIQVILVHRIVGVKV